MAKKLPALSDQIRDRLNVKEIALAYRYAENGGNLYQAARDAGYAHSTANVTAHRWLGKTRQDSAKPFLFDAIHFLMQHVLEELQVTQGDIFREMAKLGFSNINDYFDSDEHGRPTLKNWDEIPEEKRAAISSIEITEHLYRQDEDADGVLLDRKIKFKLYDKRASLETLGKYFAMWREKHEHTGKDGGPIEIKDYNAMSDDELEAQARDELQRTKATNTGA